ncbi:hypothetical protein KDA11_05290 [Candidatus Saccharibacteria bacterium]|nr:hypothetical protein [Candidatus Saccharibacteria bacterium]
MTITRERMAEVVEDQPKLILVYQTPHSINLDIRSECTPKKGEYWLLEFRDKENKIIRTIKTKKNDIRVSQLEFVTCELYWCVARELKFGRAILNLYNPAIAQTLE